MQIPTDNAAIRLRPWQPQDKPALIGLANNRRVWRNLTHTFPHPYTEADADFWIAHTRTPSANLHLAVECQGALAGGAGLVACEGIHALTAQFGYWLGEPFWGRGIATCAARALLQHALARLPFVRYEAPVFAWNPASMRVLEKVGFVREAVLRRSVSKGDELTDAVLYAYVREEGAAGAYHPLAASA